MTVQRLYYNYFALSSSKFVCTLCCTLQYGVFFHASFCYQRSTRFLFWAAHVSLFYDTVCYVRQKQSLIIASFKCALVCFVSVLKSTSFVFKWKHVVRVLSPLSQKSCGGSHFCRLKYSCNTVNPLLSPPGRLIYFKPIWGRGGGEELNRDGGLIWEGGCLFNLERTMVLVI